MAASDPAETPASPSASPNSDHDTTDPRLDERYRRDIDGITLVGVVHDHPASRHRARTIVTNQDPDVVALECPPLATPLYKEYAKDSRTPPAFGGEMSAATQAGYKTDADIVGIDAPTPQFIHRLLTNCYEARPSWSELRHLWRGVASVAKHAAICRVAASVSRRTGFRVEVDNPVEHGCTLADDPAVQAADEREQADRAELFLSTFEPANPVRLRDSTREECMVERLLELHADGADQIVTVVGLDHLDEMASMLEEKLD